jgi:hypothetical protein
VSVVCILFGWSPGVRVLRCAVDDPSRLPAFMTRASHICLAASSLHLPTHLCKYASARFLRSEGKTPKARSERWRRRPASACFSCPTSRHFFFPYELLPDVLPSATQAARSSQQSTRVPNEGLSFLPEHVRQSPYTGPKGHRTKGFDWAGLEPPSSRLAPSRAR